LQYALVIDLNIAEILLKYGANPNTQDRFGNSCLANMAERENIEAVILLLKYGARLKKEELAYIIKNNPNKLIVLYVMFPNMAHGETKAKQLSILFNDYAHPPKVGSFFPTTRRHHTRLAQKISDELALPKNKDLDDKGIKKIIEKHIHGIHFDEHGEFKKRLNLVMIHFLKVENTIEDKAQHKSEVLLNNLK